MRSARVACVVLFVAGSLLVASDLSRAQGGRAAGGRGQQPSAARPTVAEADRQDTMPSLAAITPLIPEAAVTPRTHRVRPVPIRRRPGRGATLRDPNVQTSAVSAATLVQPIAGFEGVGEGLKYKIPGAPSDINGAVGGTQFVQWANDAFAIFDKTGKLQYGPANGNTIWKGFGGQCETSNDGDPIVQYDKRAGRWVMTQFAVSGGPPFFECMAVSTTGDATGGYARYAYRFADFNDYPKFGVWPDGYYASFNMFRGDAFLGSKVCAFDRTAMLAGKAAKMQCFDIRNEGGLLPADLDSITSPPAGAPEYFLNFGVDRLNLWKFHVDWADQTKSTLSGPVAIAVTTFDPACDGGTCIPQPNSTQSLDSLADRLMYRFAYRNFGTHEAAVVNHSVKVDNRTGVRWYELRAFAAGTPTVFQQGTYAPEGAHRWMGSLAMDKRGNLLVGFSASGAQLFPSIRVSGRNASDPLNVLAAEFNVVDGKGAQGLQRWGDYTSMSVDPTDDCTFWFTAQYLDKPGRFNWHTYIARTKFQSCGP